MPAAHAQQKTSKICLDLICAFAQFNLNAGSAERGDPTASNMWIRVFNSDHYPTHACIDQRVRTGTCLAVMAARFECDVGRGTGSITSSVEGHDLGVRLTRGLCKAGADLLIIAD